jgi:hypothetical protein
MLWVGVGGSRMLGSCRHAKKREIRAVGYHTRKESFGGNQVAVD